MFVSAFTRSAATFPELSAHAGLSRALLQSALQGVKDVSQMSFVLLKQLVASEPQRREMMEAKALQAACRAVKSDKPEVSAPTSPTRHSPRDNHADTTR